MRIAIANSPDIASIVIIELAVKRLRIHRAVSDRSKGLDTKKEMLPKRSRCRICNTIAAEQIQQPEHDVNAEIYTKDYSNKTLPGNGKQQMVGIAPVGIPRIHALNFKASVFDVNFDAAGVSFSEAQGSTLVERSKFHAEFGNWIIGL